MYFEIVFEKGKNVYFFYKKDLNWNPNKHGLRLEFSLKFDSLQDKTHVNTLLNLQNKPEKHTIGPVALSFPIINYTTCRKKATNKAKQNLTELKRMERISWRIYM